MFLTDKNNIKWKKIIIASILVVILCLLGILFFDKSLFIFLRNFDSDIWHIFDIVFDNKVWLVVFGLISAIIFAKNIIKSKIKIDKKKFKFNIKNIVLKFKEITKHNYAFMVFCSVLFADILTGFLKYGFGRQRPIFFEALGQTGFYPFTSEWAFNSMPSGHAVASFAGLVMIGLLFPKWKWATWTLAVLIGVSRVCYGAHWPSDIILGAFVGMISADIIKSIFHKNIDE